MNFNSRTHEQINQSDLHQTPVKPILKILNSEQYPLLGIFASWRETTPPHLPLREISDIRSWLLLSSDLSLRKRPKVGVAILTILLIVKE